MKKYMRMFLAATTVVMLCSAFTWGGKEKNVYAFGVATSFSDTVAYCTAIQVLDSVRLDKNHFLPERELYSYQLKNYLEYDLGKPNFTCMIYFSRNRNKLEKEQSKVLSRIKKEGGQEIIPLNPDMFKFKKPSE